MNFKTIDNKQLIGNKLRLTEPVIIFNENTESIASHTVITDEVGRIDLIANGFYRNQDYAELIMKYNNISNPFSINEGDVLLIPSESLPLVPWAKVKALARGTITPFINTSPFGSQPTPNGFTPLGTSALFGVTSPAGAVAPFGGASPFDEIDIDGTLVEDSEINIRDQFVNSKRLTPRDAKRVEYLKRKAALKRNGSREILPPNVLKEDETNITIENGRIDINGTR